MSYSQDITIVILDICYCREHAGSAKTRMLRVRGTYNVHCQYCRLLAVRYGACAMHMWCPVQWTTVSGHYWRSYMNVTCMHTVPLSKLSQGGHGIQKNLFIHRHYPRKFWFISWQMEYERKKMSRNESSFFEETKSTMAEIEAAAQLCANPLPVWRAEFDPSLRESPCWFNNPYSLRVDHALLAHQKKKFIMARLTEFI